MKPRPWRTWQLAALLLMQVRGAAAEPPLLEVEGPDAERIERAIQQELDALPDPPPGLLIVRRDAKLQATVIFEGADGRRLERTISVQADINASAEEIALLAANLLSDDGITWSASPNESLDIAERSEPSPDPPTGFAPAVPLGKEDVGDERPETTSVPEEPQARPSPWNACGEPDEHLLILGADFLPYVGTSTSHLRDSVRVASINVLGGMSAGLRGIETGGAFNLQRRFACGIQLAGGVNLVQGPVEGIQIAGALNVAAERLRGLQITGGVNVVTADVRGAQLAGAFNVAEQEILGLQLAFGSNLGIGNVTGGQLAGGANVATKDVRGLQLAIGFNLSQEVTGAQVGVVNVAGGRVRGVQIGPVNVAEKSDLSIGAVSINTRGRTHLDSWGIAELGLFAAGVKHGGDHWHAIYGVGTRANDVALVAISGLGAHANVSSRLYVDSDFLVYAVQRFEGGSTNADLAQIRAVAGLRLAPSLALFAGPSVNLLLSRPDAPNWAPAYARRVGASTTLRFDLWPGGVVGVQLLL